MAGLAPARVLLGLYARFSDSLQDVRQVLGGVCGEVDSVAVPKFGDAGCLNKLFDFACGYLTILGDEGEDASGVVFLDSGRAVTDGVADVVFSWLKLA